MNKEKQMKAVFLSLALLALAAGVDLALARWAQAAADNATKPLVVYYSRSGHARMLATALKNQLHGGMQEIQSKKNRGIPTILWEQLFGFKDSQAPGAKKAGDYNPVIVVAPIYFMRLSAPARTFIQEAIPKGADVYVFTTSGGPLAGFTARGIRALVTESGLTSKGVYGFQIGKKTQADFDNETRAFLEKTPLH